MSASSMFKGMWVALVTPFQAGALDEPALRRVTRHVLAGGADGLVPVGSTGEAATMNDRERLRVLEVVLEEAAGRVPVMPGTGTNCTETTVALTRAAKSAGAQAALVVTPYYNKPTPEGQIAHFEAAAKVGLPILMYNIPGRTGVNMTVETMLTLGRLPEICGVKESSGSLDTVSELVAGAAARRLDFVVMSGDDPLALPSMAVGATGLISVVGNVAPRETWEILTHFSAGRNAEAARAHARILPLIRALFLETNPAPAKALLADLGMMHNELRLPLVPVRPATAAKVRETWHQLGLTAPAAEVAR
jgi:4-hydroxy-tetrahydrodipicolinate synthase